jgi:NADPH:quinone reductase
VDYTRADWRDALKSLTGGHGADVIFDPVGGDVSLQAFRSIAWRGRHLVVGFAAGSIPALPFNLPLLKGGSLLGVDLAQIPQREPEAQKRLMSQLFTWLTEKKLEPVVGKIFAFAMPSRPCKPVRRWERWSSGSASNTRRASTQGICEPPGRVSSARARRK